MAVPFLTVFLAETVCAALPTDDDAAWAAHLSGLRATSCDALADAEADAYWCTSYLLDGIQARANDTALQAARRAHTCL